MSIVKKITKNTFWLSTSSIIGKLIGFGIVVLVARNLHAEGFGQYSFALSFGIIISVMSDFGLSTLANRDLARNRELTKSYLDNIISMKLVLAAVTLIFLTVIIQFIDKPFQIKVIIYLASIYIIIESFNIFFRSVFLAHERMQFETISRILERGLTLGLVALFFFMGYGLYAVFIAYVSAEIVSTIVTGIIVYKKFSKFSLRFNISSWKRFIKPSIYFALTNIFIMVYFKIDVLMLSIMKGDRITGLYSSAYDLLFAFMFIPTIMNSAVFPRISYLAKNAFDKFKNLTYLLQKYFLIIAFPLSIGLYFGADFLIKFIYGNDFIESTVFFQMMTVALIFVFLNFIYGSYLNAIDKQHLSTIFAGIGMLLNLVLNFIMIPILAAKGAAIATIFTEFLLVFLSAIAIKKFIGKPQPDFILSIAKILIASVLAFVTVIYLPDYHPILRSLISFAIYLIAIFALRIFNNQDKQYFLELTKR